MKAALLIVILLLGFPQALLAQSHLPGAFTPPESISVGEAVALRVPPDADASGIQGILNQAVDQSSPGNTVRVLFAAKAEYRIGVEGDKPVLELGGRKRKMPENIEIDGRGCAFVVSSWSRFMAITRAKNVIMKNFRVDYDPKNISQGTIRGVLDERLGYYEIAIDEGCLLPDTPRFTSSDLRWMIPMEKVGDGTWGMKAGCPSTLSYKSPKPPRQLGGRRFRMRVTSCIDHGRLHGSYTGDPLRAVLETGDRVALLSRTNGRGCFSTRECDTVVFRNIEINHSPASAFGDHFSRRSCYIGVKVRPAPGELFTTTADGIFVTNQRDGPWIEDCTLRGIGDDAIVLKNSVGRYKGRSDDPGHPYVIGAYEGRFSLLPGDRIAVYDMRERKLLGKHRVVAVSSRTPRGDKNVLLEPGLNHSPANPDIWIYNLNNQCNGFVVRNNTIMDHRRWGILCSGADGSIVSNRFVRSQNAAVYLVNSDNYGDNKTGAVPRNVEIAGNRFEACWHAENSQPFGVVAARMNGLIGETRGEDGEAPFGTDWNGITNIIIKDNVFSSWNTKARMYAGPRSTNLVEHAVHGVYLRDVKNVEITGNTFIPSSNVWNGACAIKINDFENVTVADNIFRDWPGGAAKAVQKSGGK